MKGIIYQKIIYYMLLVPVFNSCATLSFAPNVDSKDIRSVALFPIVSPVIYIGEDDNVSVDENMSATYHYLISSAIDMTSLSNGVKYVDMQHKDTELMLEFMKYLRRYSFKQIWSCPVPEKLLSYIDSYQCQYGLIVVAEGMKRNNKSLWRNPFKYATVSEVDDPLTGSTALQFTAHSRYSNTYAAIIDLKNKAVIYYSKYELEDNDPTDYRKVCRQIKKTLSPFKTN